MGKRINTLNTASSPANDDYLPIDGATNGTRKISADFVNNLITDVEVDGTSVVTSGVAEIDLSGKQDTLTAGSNITIAQDGTISATDTTYTAGTNVDITGGVISATDTTYTAGTNVTIDANNVISASDTTYTAGTNVQINNGVISATDTTYSAFGGATAGADGSIGLVPQPLIADKDKFLKGDGTWDTIQPGASALDDLTNVDITSPTNGQVLKYDSTNQEWVNANESGGGGASAVADLTDVNLTSLANGQILKYDSTSQKWINSDESGGGTSGTMDILWEGTAAPTTANPITVSLNGNISDYDMIMVNVYEGTNNYKCTGTFAKLAVGDSGLLLVSSDSQLYINIEVATDSSITFKGYSSQWGSSTTYTGIYGVKFGTGGGGSGGGSGDKFVTYTKSVTTNSNGWWFIEDENGNILDPNTYIIVDISIENDYKYDVLWSQYDNDGTDCYIATLFQINDGLSVRSSDTKTWTITYAKKDFSSGGGGSCLVKLAEYSGAGHGFSEGDTITLSDNMVNYDVLMFASNYSDDVSGWINGLVTVSDFKTKYTGRFYAQYQKDGYTDVKYLTDTTISVLRASGAFINAVYGIKFANGGGNSFVRYSTSENVVGTWIDGSPVYEKTYYLQNISSDYTTIDLGVTSASIDLIWIHEGFLYNSTWSSGSIMPYTGSGAAGELGLIMDINKGSTNITVHCRAGSLLDGGNAYVTFRYTKTSS